MLRPIGEEPLRREDVVDVAGGLVRGGDQKDVRAHHVPDGSAEERVVRAPEDQRVDARLLQRFQVGGCRSHQLVARGVAAFDELDEQRACLDHDFDVRPLQPERALVGAARNGRLGADQPDVFAILDNGGGATAVGLSFAAWTLAQVSMLAFGGVVGDRIPRRVVMIGSDVASTAVRTAMGVLLVSGHAHVWELIALQGCGGAAVAFYSPASYGLVREVVHDRAHHSQPSDARVEHPDGARIRDR